MISRRLHKLFGAILLASFALVILVTGFHHHKDALSHSDCAFCVAAYQPTAVSHEDSGVMILTCVEKGWFSQLPTFLSLADRPPTFIRGPPVLED